MSSSEYKTASQLRREASEAGRPGVDKGRDRRMVEALETELDGYRARLKGTARDEDKARLQLRVAAVEEQIKVWGGARPQGRRAPARETTER